jgi:hypothetical protein
MAEEQAINRVHRMGQVHEVIATRYIVQGSIEEVCRISFLNGLMRMTLSQYVQITQKTKSAIIHQTIEVEWSNETDFIKERLMKVRLPKVSAGLF